MTMRDFLDEEKFGEEVKRMLEERESRPLIGCPSELRNALLIIRIWDQRSIKQKFGGRSTSGPRRDMFGMGFPSA